MLFKITYTDPESGESVEVEKEFFDSHIPHFISALEWAEDFAYMKGDKARYEIEAVSDTKGAA